MTVKGVTIGDRYKDRNGPHIFEVVDFAETRSMITGEVTKVMCVVRGLNTLSTNWHEVPFSTVARTRLKPPDECEHGHQKWQGDPMRRICQDCGEDRTEQKVF